MRPTADRWESEGLASDRDILATRITAELEHAAAAGTARDDPSSLEALLTDAAALALELEARRLAADRAGDRERRDALDSEVRRLRRLMVRARGRFSSPPA